MQEILVILDKPKHEQVALERALALSRGGNCRLRLVSFTYETLANLPGGHHAPAELVEEIKQGRERWLDELVSGHGLSDRVETEAVWHHSIADWILEHLAHRPADLVIKSAQKQFGGGGFGSIDWRLIEQSPSPLWLVVETAWAKRDRIVLALDPRRDSQEHAVLNERVLQFGGKLAQQLGASIEAVATLVRSPMLVELGFAQDTTPEDAQALRSHLNDTIAASGVDCSELHLPVGKPAREVNRVVDRHKARMMVVGRGARRSAGRFLLGNTAERILAKANSDVVIVP